MILACPGCGAHIGVSPASLAHGRVACQACGRRADLVRPAGMPAGAFREDMPGIELRMEPLPPEGLGDYSGESGTRWVRLPRLKGSRLIAGAGPLVAGVFLCSAFFNGCQACDSPEPQTQKLRWFYVLIGIAVAMVAGVVPLAFRSPEWILIRGGELRWRRWPRRGRIAVDRIKQVGVVLGEFDAHIALDLVDGRSIRLARGLGHGAEEMKWLAAHLNSGLGHARELRG